MKHLILSAFIFLGFVTSIPAMGQNLKSPSDFLGYQLGTKFTYHHQVIDYFEHVEKQSDKVLLYQYGQTYERRELKVAYISSPENLKNIEGIRKNNLRRTGLLSDQAPTDTDIAIIWLSYNVHGNEANSTETSMKVLYDLANGNKSNYDEWLKKLVIVLDPCLNPDGKDRYTNWYNQVANRSPNPNKNTREHQEGWNQGRSNHYMFDLNRDWVWQTQIESEQRLKLYNDWMPQVHVDFHEQYYNSQYYFAPAAQPIHELITDWQIEFQGIAGANNAKYFDEKGWLYFTNEVFDLLYPGYGDTYPTFNGAIGMTYEMPGHSAAGLAILTNKGDTLTLSDRIDMHFTTSIATIETCYQHRETLINEFKGFFNIKQDDNSYFILKSSRPDRIELLTELLDKNKIIYKSPSKSKELKAYSYEEDKIVNIELNTHDLIVPQNQPKSTLVKVLFERNTNLSDTLTYDITAWSLPFMYGLEAFQTDERMDLSDYQSKAFSPIISEAKPYAYLLNWTSIKDARFLSSILNKGIKANFSTKKFKYNGADFSAGTLIITRIDNEKTNNNYEEELLKAAKQLNRHLIPVYSGAAISSFDLGSQKISFLNKPKIAMLSGDGISTLNFGELWYFFEQEINLPIDIIHNNRTGQVDLDEYDVLLLASGRYKNLLDEMGFKKIDSWVKDGGSLILIGNAINGFIGEEKFELEKNKKDEKEDDDPEPVLYPYGESERESLKKYIHGGIIQMEIDNTHPLAYGYDNHYFTLKNNNHSYKFLEDGWNVGYITAEDKVVSGFIGSESKDKLHKNLVFGVEQRGNGKVIYFVDNPVFRAFWQNGKLFLANAVFFNN